MGLKRFNLTEMANLDGGRAMVTFQEAVRSGSQGLSRSTCG